jgi:hypothetical protein
VQLRVAQALEREARVLVLVALPPEDRAQHDQEHKAGPHRPTPSSA